MRFLNSANFGCLHYAEDVRIVRSERKLPRTAHQPQSPAPVLLHTWYFNCTKSMSNIFMLFNDGQTEHDVTCILACKAPSTRVGLLTTSPGCRFLQYLSSRHAMSTECNLIVCNATKLKSNTITGYKQSVHKNQTRFSCKIRCCMRATWREYVSPALIGRINSILPWAQAAKQHPVRMRFFLLEEASLAALNECPLHVSFCHRLSQW